MFWKKNKLVGVKKNVFAMFLKKRPRVLQPAKKEKAKTKMTEPMAERLERALAKLSYFDGDRAGGQGIGRYLLSLMIGLLGGMIPKLMNPEFTGNFTDAGGGGDSGAKTAARQSRALHLLLFLLILTSSLSSPALGEGLTPVFIATVVLYIWFSCLIKCRAVYIIGVLAMLVVAMLVHRVRAAGNGASPYYTDMMRRLEIYLYSGAMVATVGAVVMSAPGTGLDKLTGLFHFVWGKDVLGKSLSQMAATQFGESPLTTAPTSVTTFGYDYP